MTSIDGRVSIPTLLAGLFVIVVVALFAFPMPSFQRSVSLRNQTLAALDVRFESPEGKKRKQAQLSPGESVKFIYFIGDNDGRASIPVTITVSNRSSGAVVKRELALPIAKAGPELDVSAEWFSEKNR